jgi:hypothetical protein
VLNQESRQEVCLEDDLLIGNYHFVEPSAIGAEQDVRKRIALFRVSIAQLRIARRVVAHDIGKDEKASGVEHGCHVTSQAKQRVIECLTWSTSSGVWPRCLSYHPRAA